MRGLMYKQLMTFRAPALIIIGFQLFLTAVAISMYLDDPVHSDASMMLAVMIAPFILFSITNSELFRYDEREKWCCFAASTPQTSKGQVQVKYYFTLAAHSVMLFVGMLCDTVFIAVVGSTAVTCMMTGVLFFCISLIMNALEYPFYFRFGSEHGAQVKGASIWTVILLIMIYLLFGDISFLLDGNLADFFASLFSSTSMMWAMALLPAASLVIFYLSYLVSLKMYRKGMESYEQ